MSPRALACPASLKGCLSASDAAERLVAGFRVAGVEADALPVADGGEGTLEVLCGAGFPYEVSDAFGQPRWALVCELLDGTRVVEAAQAIPLDPERLDAMHASSRGLGELIAAIGEGPMIVAIGGTATMDGGAGLLKVVDRLPGPTRVLYDVTTRLYDAPRLYGPQKGARPEQIAELEARLRAISQLAPYSELPGSGAAGGLGAALASLGAELVPGAETVLDLLGFDPVPYDLVVTGEGTVDATTWEGKAPAAVARRCRDAGVQCVVFGGLVLEGDAVALSGDPGRAPDDLVELGGRLGSSLRLA